MSFAVLVSSGYTHMSGIAGSYGGLIPSFLRNLHTFFHSDYINLHSHQQCREGSLFSTPFPAQSSLFLPEVLGFVCLFVF